MERRQIQLIGLLLIIVPVIIMISWTGLMVLYEYPDILRQSVDDILIKYKQGGVLLKLCWSGLVLGSLLIVPLVLSLHRLLSTKRQFFVLIGSSFGILTALFHLLGFSRWLFFVDVLAKEYMNPLITEARTNAIEVVFHTFHMYLGVTIGETMGYITMGLWAIFTGISLLQRGIVKPWFAWLTIGSGIGIMLGILEWTGWDLAPQVNAIAYQLWIVILMILGIYFMLRSEKLLGE